MDRIVLFITDSAPLTVEPDFAVQQVANSQPTAWIRHILLGSMTFASASLAKKVVMRMLVRGVLQTTKFGPNFISATQRSREKH